VFGAEEHRPDDTDGPAAYDPSAVGAARHIAILVLAGALLAGCGGGANDRGGSGSAPGPESPALLDPAIAPARAPAPAGPHDAPVPILMYHVIATAPRGAPEARLWVPWRSFESEMAAMAKAGFHAVTLDTAYRAWRRHGVLPVRPFVVSFDDGYTSQYQHARPTLDALGWPGVLNLVVHHVGLAGGLSRHQVARLVRDGWEIDAHTITHPDLTTLGPVALRHEVAGSRAWLRSAFGVAVSFFCYPAGRYNARVEAAVRAAGFLGATTTQPGAASPGDDRFALPRVRVTPQMTAGGLVALVRELTRA
jgi:peptidoglycan/xylan/chitin deacetylase (PgdA/CDA1 family)